jgi:putative flippase GtrA
MYILSKTLRLFNPIYVLRCLLYPNLESSIEAQIPRQLLNGVICTIIDLTLFQFFVICKIPILIAAVMSYALTVTLGFFSTRFYVIGQTNEQVDSPYAQFCKFIPATLVTLAIHELFLFVFAVNLGYTPLYVKAVACPVGFIWTVLSSRFIVFKKN